MSAKDKELLYNILQAIEYVAQHQSSASALFTIERATIFELITIGEAVKGISKLLREAHTDVPWQMIAGARDRMVHDYDNVSSSIVRETVDHRLPQLKEQITRIINILESSHG